MEVRVQSLDRTFCILRTLAHEPLGLSLAEIAEVAELPRSTAFRLLAVLMQHEYVRKNPQTNLYSWGGFYQMSSHYRNSLELKTNPLPICASWAKTWALSFF